MITKRKKGTYNKWRLTVSAEHVCSSLYVFDCLKEKLKGQKRPLRLYLCVCYANWGFVTS